MERTVKTSTLVEGFMRKTFVLDTSVLLHDPRSLYAFGDNLIVIPAVVIEEIDRKKNQLDLVGRNAREVARELDYLRQQNSLSKGVELENGGTLKVELNHKSFAYVAKWFNEMNNDNRILAVTLNLQLENQDKGVQNNVVLVSKDVIMRIKADSLAIESQDYLHDKIENTYEPYVGYIRCRVPSILIDEFYEKGYLEYNYVKNIVENLNLYPNQFIILKGEDMPSKSAVGKFEKPSGLIKALVFGENSYWGIKGRNVEQRMALEALLDDEIKLVTLTGKAGTGKTLLSLAAGLYKTNDERNYKKLLITKPVIPVGRDIGFLPGDKNEKLRPWVQPIYDNLELLLGTKSFAKLEDTLVGMNRVEIEALTYIRGRSIPNQFIIIDEAQNLTRHEVKTIITRVGEGSKIILMGDTEQIDHPYLDSECNGLAYIINKFKEEHLAAHINFSKVERSSLAQLAADIL